MNDSGGAIVVMGAPHSGGRRVLSALAAHSSLARGKRSVVTQLARLISNFEGATRARESERGGRSELPESSVIESARALLDHLQHRQSGPLRQTPVHLVVGAQPLWVVNQLLPESRFVHIIRDGRMVVNDIRRRAAFKHRNRSALPIGACVKRWAGAVLEGRRFGLLAGADRYYEVRYEDLFSRSQYVLEQLCRWLNVTLEGQMLEAMKLSGRERQASGVSQVFSEPGLFSSSLGSIPAWTPEESAEFIRSAGRVNEALGYVSAEDRVQ